MFKIRLAAATAVAIAVLGVAASAQAIEIENFKTKTCLSSLGTKENGAPAVLYKCNGSENQQWALYPTPYGEGLENFGDKKCLNNKDGLTVDGNPQIMWTCYESENETYRLPETHNSTRWAIEPYGAFGFKEEACLTSLGDTKNEAPVEAYECNFGENQSWLIYF